MKTPERFSTESTDRWTRPILLTAAEAARYHPQAARFAREGDVVMWAEADVAEGYQADTHDGLRSSALSGCVKGFTKFYAPLADWLAAGNEMPQ